MQSCSRRLGRGYAGQEPAFRGLNRHPGAEFITAAAADERSGSQKSLGQKSTCSAEDEIQLQ